MTNTDTDRVDASDPELDKAILRADPLREQYVIQRLRTRRRMALVAFGQLIVGGAAIIAGGLLLPSWADRIDHMGTFLSIYFGALAGVVMAYWGIGSYERNSFGGLGSYGGYSGGYGDYGSSSYAPSSHASLVKTPRAAG